MSPHLLRLALAGSLVVFTAYVVVLGVARNLSLAEAAVGSLANTLPTMVFALLAYKIVSSWLVGLGAGWQIVGHAVLGAVYAAITYWLLIVILGAISGTSLFQFTVEPFSTRASTWQLLQNLTIYGIVAVLAYLPGRRQPAVLLLTDDRSKEGDRQQALSRYFIRSGEEIRPIDVTGIVSIIGADDYAEVVTLAGRHLVRMTLAEFEETLDPTKFIRVHRSRIVNLDRIERAESAGGGRLLLHMEGGDTVAASRTGSRLLRDRVF